MVLRLLKVIVVYKETKSVSDCGLYKSRTYILHTRGVTIHGVKGSQERTGNRISDKHQ